MNEFTEFDELKRDEETFFRSIFWDLQKRGKKVAPRGQTVLELEDYSYVVQPYVRFQSFKGRKYNLSYVKNEMLWYLRGDRFDASICDHAKVWRDVMNQDGSINSNYGHYIFGKENQFDNVVRILTEDRDSRRAAMSILDSDHLKDRESKDVPCTYSLWFRIRGNELKMSVQMRSQDAVYGMGADVPCFSFIHEMILHALRARYPELTLGSYHHFANSFHVYERHFGVMEGIAGMNKVHQGNDVFIPISCPRISGPEEVQFLRGLKYDEVPENFEFTKWLIK